VGVFAQNDAQNRLAGRGLMRLQSSNVSNESGF